MKIFVSTGEVSGDLHLSYLIKNILKEDNTIEFYGVVGENCKALGVKSLLDIKELAIIGFLEAIKKYKFLKKKAYEYLEFIEQNNIEKVILVDYGGFNLAFLKLLKERMPQVEVFYYIPPKLWIWGKKRIKTLRLADHIMVIFPWEVEFYKQYGINVIYYGNPFIEKYPLLNSENGNKILLLPGSRKQEVTSLLPEMLNLVEKNKEKEFILKLPDKKTFKWINRDLSIYKNLEIFQGNLEDAVKKSQVAIAASGTVTLELAIMGLPAIVVYKPSLLNLLIGRYLLKIKYISLPNLTENKEVYPELIGNQYNEKNILDKLQFIMSNREKYQIDIENIRKKLYGKDIIRSYSKYILEGKNEC
ncbi:lipid-A-disaccharide synthase [Fusobacterium perfoetens]|uniref:lipid-A-disaccharide synthase n=1 Tax=Fusobacterium perfoetens TaxID=852 RepID=UPI000483D4A1|nr:lipid-A-disaccharide synthase [Fusobacterium perfoetens]